MLAAGTGATGVAPLVACPDCGREFVRRGLAAHRRMRHGAFAAGAAGSARHARDPVAHARAAPEPCAPFASSAISNSDETRDLARAVDMLTDVVRRLDGHLDRLLEFQARLQPPPHMTEPAGEPEQSPEHAALDRMTLERELDLVLAEIARVRIEARGSGTVPTAAEQLASVDATRVALGKLRRRQAAVLARLLEFDRREDAALDLRLLNAPARREH